MALDPFWPSEKFSSASSTSDLLKCLISVAILSIEEAIIAKTEKNIACLSLGMT